MSKAAIKQKDLGNAEFKKGNFAKAIEFYTYATEMDPKNHVFYTNRAMCYEKMGKWAKCLRDANKSLKINSAWVKGHLRAGNAHMELKNAGDALESFKKCAQLDPAQPHYKAMVRKAEDLYYKGKSRALRLKDEGNAFYQKGKMDEAMKCYTQALKCASSTPDDTKVKVSCYANRAMCRNHEHRLIIEDCSAALKLDPMHVKALFRRGNAYEATEKYKKALADFTQVSSSPMSPMPLKNKSMQASGRIRKAMKQLGM